MLRVNLQIFVLIISFNFSGLLFCDIICFFYIFFSKFYNLRSLSCGRRWRLLLILFFCTTAGIERASFCRKYLINNLRRLIKKLVIEGVNSAAWHPLPLGCHLHVRLRLDGFRFHVSQCHNLRQQFK